MTDDLPDLPSARDVGTRDQNARGWRNEDTAEIVPGVTITPGMKVVDIGCGWGPYTIFCLKQGAHVTFIDQNPQAVEQLAQRLEKQGLDGFEAVVSECNPIPLADGSADLVICTEVLEHVDDPLALGRELARIGAEHATFVLTVPDSRGENLIKDVVHPSYFEKPNHIRVFTLEEFEDLAVQCGLEVIRHDFRGSFWAIFFLLKWATSQPGENLFDAVHPITQLWTQTWDQVLQHPDREKIVNAMNQALPNSQVIIARKKASGDISKD